MSYWLYDINGYVGDFSTTLGMEELREYIKPLSNTDNIFNFISLGASLVTDELVSELKAIEKPDDHIGDILTNALKLVERSELVAIINGETENTL